MPSDIAPLAVPDFECKLYLDAGKVLDAEFKPRDRVDAALKLSKSARRMAMLFIDARPPAIQPAGWNVRIRKFEEDDDKFEITYKRRFPLGDGTVRDALLAAAREGLDASEPDYEAQVEWGYARRTLSLSKKAKFKSDDHGGLAMPAEDVVIEEALKDLPGKLDRFQSAGWARGVLAKGHIYGPVLGRRWTGKWDGPDLDFEVWQIRSASGDRDERIVELSFKTGDEADAARRRKELMGIMRESRWLLETDVLKTDMILARY